MVLDLFFIALGLSMDAFAVAICKGLAVCKVKPKHMLLAGLWFGFFQALMPLLGYVLGSTFESYIKNLDHWIAFVLLAFIGGKMLKESFEKDDCCSAADASFAFTTMFVMAIATSIDALAAGISFIAYNDMYANFNIFVAVSFVGIITFILSAAGVKLGSIFGAKYKSRAELAGGVILVLMALKILLEHLGILAF